MAEGLIGLAGVAVGVVAVLGGDLLRDRREVRRYWRTLVLEHAAALRRCEWEQAKLIEDWRRGRKGDESALLNRIDELESQRRLQVSYLMMIPGSGAQIRDAAVDLMHHVGRLASARDDGESGWESARDAYRTARDTFDDVVRAHLN